MLTIDYAKKFRKANIERMNTSYQNHQDWGFLDWCACLSGEVGEALDAAKKLYLCADGELFLDAAKESLAKELADCYTYLDIIAHKQNISEEALLDSSLSKAKVDYVLAGTKNWSFLAKWTYLASAASDVFGPTITTKIPDRLRYFYWMLSFFAEQTDIDLENAITQKFNEVSGRVGSAIRL